MVNKKILILTSGKVSKLDDFKDKGVTLGSFNDICFDSVSNDLKLKTCSLKNFSLIYFRMVGKSLEIASLVANFARENRIKIIDEMYETSHLLPISLGKSLEMARLIKSRIKIPKTVFGDFKKLEFPYVVKSTTGQRGREVWLVNVEKDMPEMRVGKFYFAQELIPNARRIRVLVIGDRAVGAIIRQTKWNKDDTKETLSPIPKDIAKLAVESAKAVNLNISGIDILVNIKTNEKYVIEANAAPAWKLINKYCNINVEDEIIKYLQTKV